MSSVTSEIIKFRLHVVIDNIGESLKIVNIFKIANKLIAKHNYVTMSLILHFPWYSRNAN